MVKSPALYQLSKLDSIDGNFFPVVRNVGYFGHRRFRQDIWAKDVLATENAKGRHFGQTINLDLWVCGCVSMCECMRACMHVCMIHYFRFSRIYY